MAAPKPAGIGPRSRVWAQRRRRGRRNPGRRPDRRRALDSARSLMDGAGSFDIVALVVGDGISDSGWVQRWRCRHLGPFAGSAPVPHHRSGGTPITTPTVGVETPATARGCPASEPPQTSMRKPRSPGIDMCHDADASVKSGGRGGVLRPQEPEGGSVPVQPEQFRSRGQCRCARIPGRDRPTR